jgi:hypothetical protein
LDYCMIITPQFCSCFVHDKFFTALLLCKLRLPPPPQSTTSDWLLRLFCCKSQHSLPGDKQWINRCKINECLSSSTKIEAFFNRLSCRFFDLSPCFFFPLIPLAATPNVAKRIPPRPPGAFYRFQAYWTNRPMQRSCGTPNNNWIHANNTEKTSQARHTYPVVQGRFRSQNCGSYPRTALNQGMCRV